MKPTLAQLQLMKTASGERVKIINTVTPRWTSIGIQLNFDPDGQMLRLIEAEHKIKGEVACCERMFMHWLAGNGKPATWGTLIELLEDLDYNHLAQQIKVALSL